MKTTQASDLSWSAIFSVIVYSFCYHHYSQYFLLGWEFSTNLLSAASKCQVEIRRQREFKFFKIAERLGGCSCETFLAPCARKKGLQRKMTKDKYSIGAQENISMSSKS